MTPLNPVRLASAVVLLAVGFGFGALYSTTVAQAQSANKVFELRTYTAPEGKLPDLNARFRNHTMRIFQKHGMSNVGYWVPQDAPAKDNTLIYIISHASREAAKKSWADFGADPEWKKVSAESQVNGRIVTGVVSVFMDATDYSPIK
ncbi:MAG: NIPSNAP family protein [Acidobacteriota bacterium]|nr:NIPSNAP family protein [Acidobacteriota bacterium]